MYIQENTKDFKKGVKDANKDVKKLHEISKETLNSLMSKVEKRTQNELYLDGYCDIIRQEIAAIA